MILRDPTFAAESRFDVIIVGGGIQGVCTLLEATMRGLRSLLIERNDFGGATSWNSLRILHGGLRYLQYFDLRRYHDSVTERQWFCREFPELVRPLPCLMPLYGNGLKRRSVLRLALWLNDRLSRYRNDGVVPQARIPNGKVLGIGETCEWFPGVDRDGLTGAALWYDAAMSTPQRILIEALRWACSLGAVALNYVEVTALCRTSERVCGVRAYDRVSGDSFEFRGAGVINCAGPWCRQVASVLDHDVENLFRPSLAFNVLFDKEPPSRAALALQPRRAGAPVYFLHSCHGGLLAGTVHATWSGGESPVNAAEKYVDLLIEDLNQTAPELELRRGNVLRIFAGLLPAVRSNSARLSRRDVIFNHGKLGGPQGLLSVCGVKYTTARRAAQNALAILSPQSTSVPSSRKHTLTPINLRLDDPSELLSGSEPAVRRELHRLLSEEAVVCLDDLVFRRTDWGISPREIPRVRQRIEELLAGSSASHALKLAPTWLNQLPH